MPSYRQVIQQAHIGVSILDARSLRDVISDKKDVAETNIIESHHFVVRNSNFARPKSNRFLFGKFETVSLPEIRRRLDVVTGGRNVVLVCHGGDREQHVLSRMDINVHPLPTIDTVKAAQHPLQLPYRYSLEKLLEVFGIPFTKLHSAGNDAHFVLRTLLMIVVRDANDQLGSINKRYI